MTRRNAIKALKWFKEYNEEDYCGGDRIQNEYGIWYYRVTEQDFMAFDMAIEALEQEPKSEWEHDHEILKAYSDGQASIITVLEAIKAEIEQSRYGLINDGLDVALKIIDKHISEMGDMAEIEPQESEENKGCDNDDLSKLLIELAERCLQNNSDTIHLTLNTPKSNLHCYIKFSTEKKAESEG